MDREEYNDMPDLIEAADQKLKMDAAEEIAKVNQSARFQQMQVEQRRHAETHKAIIDNFGSMENYNAFRAENPNAVEEALIKDINSHFKKLATRARDERGRFKKTRIQKISEQRASGQLSSDDALQIIVDTVLFEQ